MTGVMCRADRFSGRTSGRAFAGVSALLFAGAAALTVARCQSMSAMPGMPMPGGWTMSMAWMRMPGQTWTQSAASFIGMWVVMMVPMMYASLAAMLWRYRRAVGSTADRSGWLTPLVAVAYFFVWTLFGVGIYPLGIALAAIQMRHPMMARTAPIACGVVVLIAGAIQFTSFKAHRLRCCREAPGGRALPADSGTAWRIGLRLGIDCSFCCANLMLILLVLGVMDLRAMAVVTAAMAVERLTPEGEPARRAVGIVAVAAALLMIARPAGLTP